MMGWKFQFHFRKSATYIQWKSCLVWYFSFEWHYVQEDFTLHFPSPKSKQSKPSRDQGQKVETCCAKCCQNVVHCQIEARENKEPTPHAPPPLCFEFFFWIANNLKKAILFCCTKQSDKSNNCYVVSFRNIERNFNSFQLLDVGWEHSRSNKVLWGIGPAFWLENWGWMRGSWFWTGYCTFICKVQRGKRQCSAISIGQNILSLTSTQSMNYFELKRHWRGCDSTDGFGLFE